jgi:hypothetical protein
MAKQIGEIKIVGTFADITFYKMDGQYYARKKTSLTGKRVKRDPKFARTMASARRLGRGSQLASKVYRSLPRTEQVYAVYKYLKRLAVLALKEGAVEAEVFVMLQRRVGKAAAPEKKKVIIVQKERNSKTRSATKHPKLFRTYGGSIKKVGRQRIKCKRCATFFQYTQRE